MTLQDLSNHLEALTQRLDRMEQEHALLREAVASLQPRRQVHIPAFCHLGRGTNIDPTVTFYASTEAHAIHIGDGTKILRGAEWIGPIRVGSGCYFNRDSYIRSFVTVGNDVLVGPYARFVTDTHRIGPAAKRGGPVYREPISVGDGVWIGASVTIIAGVTIGAGAIVAAGAVVTKDVPPNTVVGGTPARVLRELGG